MQIEIGEPRIIAESSFINGSGIDHWGYYQFPTLERLLDGRIAVTFHINADSAKAYGKATEEPNRGVTSDDGETWERVESTDPQAGLLLPNGERLLVGMASVTPPALSLDGLSLPHKRGEIEGSYGQGLYELYRHDELPSELKGIPAARLLPGAEVWVNERGQLHDPELLCASTEGVFPVVHWGDVHLLSDGALLGVLYPARIEGADSGQVHCSCYRSEDHGRSWFLRGRLPYRPDTEADPLGARRDGFTEPASLVLPDGEILAVLRTTDGLGNGPLYLSRSGDGGASWSHPVVITKTGVLPRLLRLGNGILVLSTGRPGAELLFSADGRGETWSDRIDLVPVVGPDDQMDSCGYTSLLALDDDTFLVAYSWFKKPTQDGHTRKAIMVRRVELTV